MKPASNLPQEKQLFVEGQTVSEVSIEDTSRDTLISASILVISTLVKTATTQSIAQSPTSKTG